MITRGTVVLSYTQTGYRLRRRLWDDADLAVDLSGRTCVVTGANSGLGFATVQGLLERGANVVMVCRNANRSADALALLRELYPLAALDCECCDLSDLDAVELLAQRLLARHPQIHVLVNNAGVLLHDRQVSAQGIELAFATNVLAGFLLTNRLLPALVAAAPARIIHVTSGGALTQRLNLTRLRSDDAVIFDGLRVYAQTKRAQIILNEQYGARLDGTGVTSNAMHPGWAATTGVARALPRFNRLLRRRLRSAEQGADTILWLAASPKVTTISGKLWFDRRTITPHALPWTRSSPEERERLWITCQELTRSNALGGI